MSPLKTSTPVGVDFQWIERGQQANGHTLWSGSGTLCPATKNLPLWLVECQFGVQSLVEHGGFEPPTPCLPGKITCVVACRLVSSQLGHRRCGPVLAAAVFAHGRAELDDDGLAQLGEHDADGEGGRRSHGLMRASCLTSKHRFKASVGPRFEAIWRGRGPLLAGSATGRVGHRRCEAAAIAERTRWSRSTPHQHFGACPHGDVKSPCARSTRRRKRTPRIG